MGSASRGPTSQPQMRPLPPGPSPQPNGTHCLNRFSTATKPVRFRGRRTRLGSLCPLPSLRPVPGSHEVLPTAHRPSLSLPLCPPPRLSPLPSCRRVPLTASEGEASASLLSTSQQLREELATRNPRTGKLGSGAEPRRSEVTQRTAAAPGFSRGLRTPVPCSFPASGHSVIREPDQVQELPAAGVCAGCRVRNRESGRGSIQGTLLR